MRITREIFDAFLHCPTKGYLMAHGEAGHEEHEHRENVDAYRRDGLVRLGAETSTETNPIGNPASARWMDVSPLPRADLKLETAQFVIRIDALRIRRGKQPRDLSPIRFVPDEEVAATDKLSVAFDARVVAESTGSKPSIGEIIHGRDYRTVNVSLAPLYPKISSRLVALNRNLAKPTAPSPILNKHCPECCYRAGCRE
ncbi:MAG TPA: hypothetical protein VG297_20425, partial [Bryobacteraceae bacterium]|nr:hypothetical protein [Bryobacteraceae bacterium]